MRRKGHVSIWPRGAGVLGRPRGRASFAHRPGPAHCAPPCGPRGSPRGRRRCWRARRDGGVRTGNQRGQVLEGCQYWLLTDFRHFTSTNSMGRTWRSLSIVKPSTHVGPDSGRGRASFLSSGMDVARTWVPGVWHLQKRPMSAC